ncbi:MAG: cation:proton antiporter [Gammaproteobacteria bacterium]|nr:MAG: cation:proton antiporter [Gammaproteobacteria bacterium]
MQSEQLVFSIFLIFTGAAVLATLALYARQSLLVAYILLGVLFGPWGAGLVADIGLLKDMAHIGIIFLLFLLGLHLPPQKLIKLFGEAVTVTAVSSAASAGFGFAAAALFGFGLVESAIVGMALLFSSTIIGLKLLPTTVLHHQRIGAVVISILLLQDLLAIVALLVLQGMGRGTVSVADAARLAVSLPGVIAFAFLAERYLLRRLFLRFDRIREYLFLAAIGWCLGVAALAHAAGLTYEIGAFVAGVAIATGPIALYIAENLRPLRDFFLILFFFSLGASFDLSVLSQVLAPALLLSAAVMLLKPLVFRSLLVWQKESVASAWEIGVRLGQTSEFSLLVAFMAFEVGVIGARASYLIQLTTLLTFIASSYYIVRRFPTPIATSDRLRRD